MVGRIHGLRGGAGGVSLGWGVISKLHDQLRPEWILEAIELLLGVHRSLDGAVGDVGEAPGLPCAVISLHLTKFHPGDQIKESNQLILGDGWADEDKETVADSALVSLVGLAREEIHCTVGRARGADTESHGLPRAVALVTVDGRLSGLAGKLG